MQPLHKRSTLHTRARAPAYTRRHALARIREPDGSRHPGKHRNPLELETEIELKIEVALTCAQCYHAFRFSLRRPIAFASLFTEICLPFPRCFSAVNEHIFFFELVPLLARLNNFLILSRFLGRLVSGRRVFYILIIIR